MDATRNLYKVTATWFGETTYWIRAFSWHEAFALAAERWESPPNKVSMEFCGRTIEAPLSEDEQAALVVEAVTS